MILKNKIAELNTAIETKKNVYLTMITTYGVKENEYSIELVQNNISMDCLFINSIFRQNYLIFPLLANLNCFLFLQLIEL